MRTAPSVARLGGMLILCGLALTGCPEESTPAPTPSAPCAEVACGDNAQCVVTQAGATDCACDAGYGKTSEGSCVQLDACTPNPCTDTHRSQCTTDNGQAVCGCDPGFADVGGTCEPLTTNPCAPNPCTDANKTVCLTDGANPVCQCDPGYVEDTDGTCVLPFVDVCDPNPCIEPNKSICTEDGFGIPSCGCDPGYAEDAFGFCLPEVVDPCDPNPCTEANKSVCADVGGVAECACEPGYVDDGFGSCIVEVVDPCNPNPCDAANKAICTADGDSPICSCDVGYVEDVDGSCILEADPCDPNPCTDVGKTVCSPSADGADGAVCSCADGFTDDGNDGCEPVIGDPCDPNPCVAANQGVCVAVGGAAVCECDPGFHDDGLGTCTDDPCLPNPCVEPNATQCVASGGGVLCECDPGYVPGTDGCELEVADPCMPNPCSDILQTQCTATGADTYSCGCDPGAHPDGQGGCTTDPCIPNPCTASNQSICVTDAGTAEGYVCECAAGWFPDGNGGCVDACTPNPCAEPNKTACDPTGGVATCSCDPGFHDDGAGNCTDDPCLPDPCTGGQVCSGTPGTSQYECLPCLDGDGDGYGVGAGCLGPDCDDSDINSFSGCPCPAGHDEGDGYEQDECWFIATDVTSGAVQDHTIWPAGDVDYLAFDAAAGDLVTIATNNQPAMRIHLVDRDGLTSIENDYSSTNSTNYIDREIPAPGTWYVLAEGRYPDSTGDYSITVTNLGPNDHGTGPETATPVVTDGNPVAGDIEIGGNEDWFTFDVVEGHMYQLRAQSQASTGIRMELYDTDGVSLIESDTASYSSLAFIDRGELEAGTYYVRIKAYSGSSSKGPYEFWITDLGQDDHGDAWDEATALPTDGTKLGALFEVGGNVDYFSFDVVEGHAYQIRAQADGTGVRLQLYDSDGVTSLEVDSESYSTTAFIDRGSLEAGTYYLRLSPYSGSTSFGSYDIWVTDLGLDDHGDDWDEATSVATDASIVAGSFEVGGNVDWFTFDVIDGHAYQMRAQADGCGINLRLYDTDGSTLIEGDTESYSTIAFIDRGELPGGTYFLRVQPYSGSSSFCSYTVWVTDLGPDDHGDGWDEATPLPTDSTKTAALFEVGGNTDWFSFEVEEGHMYQMRAQGDGTGVSLHLYDTDGTTFLEQDVESYSTTAFIDRGSLAAGTYYLRVKPYSGSKSFGSYDIWVTDLGLDDHGDDEATATPLPTDASLTGGLFEVGGNVDYFSFVVTAGHSYAMRAKADGCGVRMELYDDAGSLIETDYESYSTTAFIDRGNLDAGTYYLKVRPYSGSSSIGSYDIWVTDLGLDDHGDDPQTATWMTIDGPAVDGFWEVGNNADWFKFDAVAGVDYTVSCTPTGAGCRLTRYEADGSSQVSQDVESYSTTAALGVNVSTSQTVYFRAMPYSGNTSIGAYTMSVVAN